MSTLSLFEKLFLNYDINLLISKLVGVTPFIVSVVALAIDIIIHEKMKKEGKSSLKIIRMTAGVLLILLIVLNLVSSFNGCFDNSATNVKEGIYFGDSVNGIPNGYGRLYYKKTHLIKYIGNFKNGVYEGNGKRFYYENYGDKRIVFLGYDGEFHNGFKNGEGNLYTYIAGEEKLWYRGEYLNDERNGYAEEDIYYNDDGTKSATYTGGFAYDNKCGYGTYMEFDENEDCNYRYRGVYWMNKKHGKGTLEYKSVSGYEDVYVGYFSDNEFSGEGIIYSNDGEILEQGIYKNGDLQESKELSLDEYPFPDECIWQN